jgi:hypothetical protein
MHKVLVITDHLGRTLQILHPGDGPPTSPSVTYRVAFESDDMDEVVQAAKIVNRRLQADRRPVPEHIWAQIEREAAARDAQTRAM